MRRGDGTVITVSVALAAIVGAAVTYSQLVLDRKPAHTIQTGASTSSLLVMTWGPTLCAAEQSNPGCASGHVQAMGPALTLHGLWPQPRSQQLCGVSHTIADEIRSIHGEDMPTVSLPPDLEATLQSMMSDASIMAPHEWYTHGTCSGVSQVEYFTVATQLAEQASSVLNPIFSGAKGIRLAPSTIRTRLDQELGIGAGSRASLTCRQLAGEGSAIYEIQLSLPPVVELPSTPNKPSLGDLMRRGPTTSPGCQDGRVP